MSGVASSGPGSEDKSVADTSARAGAAAGVGGVAGGIGSAGGGGGGAMRSARANSDVDFLVEMEPGRTALDLSELILDLQETLGSACRCRGDTTAFTTG